MCNSEITEKTKDGEYLDWSGYGRVKACAASFHSVLGNVRFLVHSVRRDTLTRGTRASSESSKKFQRMTEMLTNNIRGLYNLDNHDTLWNVV